MRDGDRNRMGQNQLEVAFPLVTKGKKGVGIIRTTVNLSIRRVFYCTFRAKLRASAVSGCRTDPPELGLAARTCSLLCAQNSPEQPSCSDVLWNTQCCSWLRAASFTSSSECCECSAPRQNWVPPNLWWAEHFFSSDETTALHLPIQCFCSCCHSTRRFSPWGSM